MLRLTAHEYPNTNIVVVIDANVHLPIVNARRKTLLIRGRCISLYVPPKESRVHNVLRVHVSTHPLASHRRVWPYIFRDALMIAVQSMFADATREWLV